MGRNKIDMCNGPLYKNLWKYIIPIMLTSILQLLFNAADMIVIGQYCGKESVAAVAATGALSRVIINLFAGFAVGVSVTVAQAIGRRDKAGIHKAVHTSIPTGLLCGIVVMIIGLVFSRKLLILSSTPSDILDASTTYLTILFIGMPFCLLYNFGASIFRATGDTKTPLIFLSVSGVVNVVLNIFFVTVFKLNVAGVALATSISHMLSAFLVTRGLMKRTDECRYEIKKTHIYKNEFLKIIIIGLPAGLQSSCIELTNAIIQSAVNFFGSTVISGVGAGGNIEGFVYVAMDASVCGCLNYCGANFGSGNYKRIKKSLLYSLINVTLIGLVLGVTSFVFARPLLSIYLKNSFDAIESGRYYTLYVGVFYCICGIMNTLGGALRGIGHSKTPLIVTVLGACGLRVLWVFTLFSIPKFHTLSYLFISWPASWLITTIIEIPIVIYNFHKIKKIFAE